MKANETATTSPQRLKHVSQMRASFAIEGIEPMSDDLAMQQRYVEGTLSLAGMLQHAHDYVRAWRNAANH
jgi:Antitoxin VbhA